MPSFDFQVTDPDIMASNDLTNCPVCLEKYDTDKHIPRILSCFHTLCQVCLATFIQQTPRRIQCSECRKAIKIDAKGITAFQQNKYIMSFLQQESEKAKNAVSICIEHNRALTHYCKGNDCKKLICYQCQQGSHSAHDVVEVEDPMQEQNETITVVDKDIKEAKKELDMTKQMITYYNNFAIAKIESARERFIEKVNKYMDELKELCTKRSAQNSKHVDDLIMKLEENIQMLNDIRAQRCSFDMDAIEKIKQSITEASADTNTINFVAYLNRNFPKHFDKSIGKLVDVRKDLMIPLHQNPWTDQAAKTGKNTVNSLINAPGATTSPQEMQSSCRGHFPLLEAFYRMKIGQLLAEI